MSRITFRKWLEKKENNLFWKQPLPSEKMDSIVIELTMQKSIASSKRNQELYSFIENHIVAGYTRLIDYKLREIYQSLSLDDFKEPDGFERIEKASVVQLQYFLLRSQLEFFLKNDIQQHKADPDAELNAFRRWTEIAKSLLKRHCYEGFLLIFTNLQLIARPDLVNALPNCIREDYNQLCVINKPDKNHGELRQYMKDHQNETDFSPLLFSYHAITMLNEAIDKLKREELLLVENDNQLIAEINLAKKLISNKSTREKTIERLQVQRMRLAEGLKNVERALEGNLEQCNVLLDRVKQEQKHSLQPLPSYINESFTQIEERFSNQEKSIKKVSSSNSLRDLNAAPSTLYSHKLLPSLWKRKGVAEDKYWEKIFTTSLKN